jgi:hypothetical protein
MKNQNDTALDLMPSPLSQGSLSPSRQETTAGHIVRNAALGAYLFKGKCSTLILSTENRGGSFDDFAKTAPKPGFTNTAAVELVPAKAWPALMIAYSRQGTLGSAPSRQFLARIRFGLPKPAFRTDIRSACAQR